MPLVVLGEHVINLDFLTNAYIEREYGSGKYLIRYFIDSTNGQEDDEGNPGKTVSFPNKKSAVAALQALATASDTLVIEDEP